MSHETNQDNSAEKSDAEMQLDFLNKLGEANNYQDKATISLLIFIGSGGMAAILGYACVEGTRQLLPLVCIFGGGSLISGGLTIRNYTKAAGAWAEGVLGLRETTGKGK